MRTRVVVVFGMVVGLFSLSRVGWADDASMAGDKADLQVLKARLEKLEKKIADQEAAASTTGASTNAGGATLQLPSGLQGVQLSGFVDTSIGYNFNVPHTRTNTLRAFDTQSESFMINNAEINLQKPVSADSRFGFKTSLMFGTDAEVVGGVTTGLGIDGNTVAGLGNDEVELKDAYAEYLFPLGEGLDVMAGKFATLHGAEVIESMNDWNISRSFLFGFAIPFTHTGVRATYPWTKWLSTTVGFNNGWDVVDDNNLGKTLETEVTITPNDKTSLVTNYMVGPEQGAGGSNSHMRHLIDIVASYQPIDPLQLKANLDYGFEQKGVGIHENASWIGVAGYARYALNDWWALASRLEWFHDADGVRTGFRPTGTFGVATPPGNNTNGITGFDLNLWELTLTNEIKLNKHLIGRLEYRHDQASEHIFRKGGTGNRPYQDTVGLEFIAPF